MIKKYKLINFTIDENDNNENVIIAYFSETEDVELFEDIDGTDNFDLSKPFVIPLSIFERKAIKIFNYQILELNDSDFIFGDLNFSDGTMKAYIHKSLTNFYSIVKDFTKENKDIDNYIDMSVLKYNIDMFFIRIFRTIIVKEFITKQKLEFIKLMDVFDKYKKLCECVLLQPSTQNTIGFTETVKREFEDYNEKYSDLMKYAKQFFNELLLEHFHDSETKREIKNEFSDSESPMFEYYKKCMGRGYAMALNRIKYNIDSSEYFDIEFAEINNKSYLKIFPTPYGLLNQDKLFDFYKEGTFNDILDNYLKTENIERVSDKTLIDKFKTKFIFKVKENEEIYVYKKNAIIGMIFNEQDPKAPISALAFQGQINLFNYKDF